MTFRGITEAGMSAEPLADWGVRDAERGRLNLAALERSLGPDRFAVLAPAVSRLLPDCPDPDMALNNLERLLAQPAAADRLDHLLADDARGLDTLFQLLGTSQFFGDLLAANPDFLDQTDLRTRHNPDPDELRAALRSEAVACADDAALLRAFRRFRQREMLRIGVNDIILDRPLEEITFDLSNVADATLAVALETALSHSVRRYGEPFTADGQPARMTALAFGKLGGQELNYSSDIDLMFVYDEEGSTRGRRGSGTGNDDFFAKVVSEAVRLLSDYTDRGQAYRVDLRLRPEGRRGPLARSLAGTLAYYDSLGRTWERQALIKVRPVAGDPDLGRAFVSAIEPFVYRRYLGFAEINEIKATKRRIEQKVHQAGETNTEVKTGHGGIRDIEFATQFLQLLNGGDLPEVRLRNTLLALRALSTAGCLTDQEYHILDDAYRFLRKTEHRLQLLFDLQTHRLPDLPEELHKLALRMGYGSEFRGPSGPKFLPDTREPTPDTRLRTRDLLVDPLDAFLHDYHEKTTLDRKILEHLLHQTFGDGDERAEPESDLILDPDPDQAAVRAVLARYPFRDRLAAYQNLIQLAQEAGPFLSTRRCRHFLASIAPQLLRALAETPDPDMALVNLEKVTASLGAKAVLWELFSLSPPSLKLYVDLCATSQFLSEILINNPGMSDELLDSLVLNQPRTRGELQAELTELCRGADDPEPILHSFQDKELLRIGVRDILGKDPIRTSNAALSDLAETILAQLVALQEPPLRAKFGEPLLDEGLRVGRTARFVLLALGTLGGRELSYHSDLDLVLVYEGDGHTAQSGRSTKSIDNLQYFSELAQRVIKSASTPGTMGRLYAVDMRLRPGGKDGPPAIPLAEFRRYYESGTARLWERQAMTRARVVFGDPGFAAESLGTLQRAVYGRVWRPEWVDEVLSMRAMVEDHSGPNCLKRGPGGIVDIEFIVQVLQLKYGPAHLGLRTPIVWEALDTARDLGLLADDEHVDLLVSYGFLRTAEGRLRIVTNRALTDLPESADDCEKLARRLGYEPPGAAAKFLADRDRFARRTRELFQLILDRERESQVPAQ
jgi:glutamate-ammonia-ligase adenylyltransferase